MPSLALAMIVRNEAANLPIALNSVRDLVDEVVIAVDSSTDDKTWEVAEAWLKDWDPTGTRYTLMQGLVLEDVGFADCRNHCLEKVRSDWILILDADERCPAQEKVKLTGAGGFWYEREIRSHHMIRMTLQNAPPEVDLLVMDMLMSDDDEKFQSGFQAERLMRKGIRFASPIHNYVANAKHPAVADAQILHTRKDRSPQERKFRAEQRLRTAKKFLLPLIEKDPKDTRSLFYMAGSYGEAGEHDKAADLYRRYLACDATWSHERYQAAVFLVRSLLNKRPKTPEERQQNLVEARKVAVVAIGDNYNRGEAYFHLGQLAEEAQEWKEAIHWYKCTTMCEYKRDPHFVEASVHSWLPHTQLAVCYAALGDREASEKSLQDAKDRDAPEGAIDFVHRRAIPRYGPTKKMGVFVDRGDTKFIDALMKEWAYDRQVIVCDQVEHVEEVLGKVDCAWFEWAGPLLIKATSQPHKCRMIVRVHGYELHAGYIPQVNWGRVDTVIFVAEYLKDIALRQVPQIAEFCQILVIPGGVEHAKYSIGMEKAGNKIAMAGYFNKKKRPDVAIEILAEAKKQRPDLELHICGTIQDSQEWLWFGTLATELGLRVVEVAPDATDIPEGDVFIYPWQDNLNTWFADKDYILSTSVEESFHYAVAQGMAAGLHPIIRCWQSSRDFYQSQWIFRTVQDAVAMLTKPPPNIADRLYCRHYVSAQLNHSMRAQAIQRVLERHTICIPAPDGAPWRYESALAKAFAGFGLAPGVPQDAEILLCLEGAADWLNLPRNGKPQKRIFWHAAQVVGKQRDISHRRKVAQKAAKSADLTICSLPYAKGIIGAQGVLYQGGAREEWRNGHHPVKDIELSFVGTPNKRRVKFGKKLGKEWNVTFAASDKLEELADVTHRSKIALNIHWTDAPNAETRVSEVLAAGTFLLTEKLTEGHPFPEGLFVEWETEDELMEKVRYYLEHDEEREAIARRGCDWVWSNMSVAHQAAKLLDLVRSAGESPCIT